MDSISEQFAQSFTKVLNRHGYGFQYSLIEEAKSLFDKRRSSWRFEASEFPVEVQGSGTKIDFILRRDQDRDGFDRPTFYLVAECKRTNAALSKWCFVRAPYVSKDAWGQTDFFVMDRVQLGEDGSVLSVPIKSSFQTKSYHLGFEVRSNEKGDESGESGQNIEKAATQVSRGLNGLINTFAASPSLLVKKEAYFLPVIFTTADLFVSDADISLTDLSTGKMDVTKEQLQKVNWLLYQYPMSPGLKHSLKGTSNPTSISELLNAAYVRSIPVVNPKGMLDFLGVTSSFDLMI
jgi:hypothetical protein